MYYHLLKAIGISWTVKESIACGVDTCEDLYIN